MAADDVHAVHIEPGGLEGILGSCFAPRGIVVFAHGSGSGRFSPRNSHVAAGLRQASMATLLLDLLHADEQADRRMVFDIPLLASRLLNATQWLRRQDELKRLPRGFFGASTGAAAALAATAASGDEIAAVVSRGGRPDLAGPLLGRIHAPTLLIVGSLDTPVIELNRQAWSQLSGPKELAIIPGAGHLFEEGDTLDQVIRLAAAWFLRHFPPSAQAQP